MSFVPLLVNEGGGEGTPDAESSKYDVGWIVVVLLQQLLPGDGFGEDLALQPEVIVHLEVLGQIHALAQDALQAVVHGQEVGVSLVVVVAAAVEALDVSPQRTLLGLEVPRPRVQVWGRGGSNTHTHIRRHTHTHTHTVVSKLFMSFFPPYNC